MMFFQLNDVTQLNDVNVIFIFKLNVNLQIKLRIESSLKLVN